MNTSERFNHRVLARRCGFVSVGGSVTPRTQRCSSSGQNVATPGKISKRNPMPAPSASESKRSTPNHTKTTANASPTPAYAINAYTNAVTRVSNIAAIHWNDRSIHVFAPVSSQPSDHTRNRCWLNPLANIRIRHRLTVRRSIYCSRQNYVGGHSHILSIREPPPTMRYVLLDLRCVWHAPRVL